jgi:hypothetical protein
VIHLRIGPSYQSDFQSAKRLGPILKTIEPKNDVLLLVKILKTLQDLSFLNFNILIFDFFTTQIEC